MTLASGARASPTAGSPSLRAARVVWLALSAALVGSAMHLGRRAFGPSVPEELSRVSLHRLDVLAPIASRLEPAMPRDFDGDGVADAQTVELAPSRSWLGPDTHGLLRVVSGASGELLLARVVPAWTTPVTWYGDHDGNGTDDLLVVREGSFEILARAR